MLSFHLFVGWFRINGRSIIKRNSDICSRWSINFPVMSRISKWKLEKTKVKVVFRLQFHATHVSFLLTLLKFEQLQDIVIILLLSISFPILFLISLEMYCMLLVELMLYIRISSFKYFNRQAQWHIQSPTNKEMKVTGYKVNQKTLRHFQEKKKEKRKTRGCLSSKWAQIQIM